MNKVIKLIFLLLFINFNLKAATITVTSPNGGESLNSCTSKNITWTSSGTSNFYNIDYSMDRGVTWISLATSYQTTGGSFAWNIPNNSSVNAMVRVTDALNTSVSDVSNSVFVINGALIVLSPNGGENFISGTTQNITYSYISGVVNNIMIEYTYDGTTWNTVTSSTPATGTYAWLIPNTPSNVKAKIRLTDLVDPGCKTDTSNISFSITSTLSVIAPNGGGSLQAVVGSQGSTVIMNNAPEKLNTASFYDDGGLSNNYSTSSYTKTVKPDFPTNKLKVTFQSYYLETGDVLTIYDGPSTAYSLIATISGSSSSAVSFQATNSTGALTFKYQSDGDGLVSTGWDAYISSVGTATTSVSWSIVGTSKYFNIDYSTNSGASWTRVISNYYTTTGIYAWQVPNTPTTNARIKVTDANNSNIVDQSDADFTILAATPFFQITSPNGGEAVYPTNFTNIIWNSAFTGLNVAIDYSIDNGSTWNPIIGSTPNITETYSWLVPNSPSNKCLIKIKDASNPSAYDVSDANFTIRPFITVANPNGGESKVRCSAYTLNWVAGGTSGYYNISYSVDGGTAWAPVTTNYYGTSYAWTLPNVITSQLKVKVSDYNDTTKFDISDAGTTLTLPASPVRMIAPNGGETWVTGTTQNITYAYGTGTTYVDLDYSTDFGRTWTNIVSGTTANGSYAWSVPDYPSDSVLVKVTGNQYNGCDYDISDAKLKIASSVAVTAPNGGETWQATVGAQGTSINMSNATMVINTANYYDAGGVNSNYGYTDYTQTFVPDNPLNKLKINITEWAFGSRYTYLSGQEAHLYIYDGPTTSSQIADLSFTGGSFTYTATSTSGALTFKLVCNGYTSIGWKGYITSVGTATKNINWNIIGTSKRFDLDYSVNGGNNWTRIVSDLPVNTGTYAWQVPNTPTTLGRVRVRDAFNNVIVDSSDNNFTISPVTPVYVITTPNGGNVVYPTNTATIKWYSAFVGPFVNLDYSIDNGLSWLPIIANYPNYTNGSLSTEGTYPWVVPNTPSIKCLIRVSDANNAAAFDVSDANFTIKPFITVLTPNGGESKARCSAYSITWNAGGTSGFYNLSYSTDGGTTWTSIATNYNAVSYAWTLPNVLTSQLKVKVSDFVDTTKFDISDLGTSLTLPPSPVRMIAPNGGETWVTGTNQYITYAYGTGTSYVDLDYSTDFGRTWTNIVSGTTANGSYLWNVPDFPSDSVLVKVTGNQYSGCDYDVNDTKMKIASSLVVTAPNGNETWQATVGTQGNNINMSNATMVINTANYYDAGGANSNYGYTDYVQTFVPDNPLNKLKINITEWAFGSRYTYLSGQEAHLYIYDGPSTSAQIADLSFTGGSFTYTATSTSGALTFKLVCNGYTSTGWKGYITSVGTATKNINWNIIGTSKHFDLDYSINGGYNWTRIVSDLPVNTGTYAWQVPNTPTNLGRVRVRDAVNNVIVDSSDNNFTISPVTPVYVITALNGGNNVYPTNTTTLKWYSAFVGPYVNLDYSIDNGTTWIPIIANYPNYTNGSLSTEGTYPWVVPNTPSTRCLIRVSDANNAAAFDVSDANFTIKPFITVLTPNGGEGKARCSAYTITWNAGGTSGFYNLSYTTDGGTTWTSIVTNYNAVSYAWTLPNVLTSQLKVKVSDYADTTKFDISDAGTGLTLPASPVRMIAPNGGETWVTGTTQYVTYAYGTGTTYVDLDYSTDFGKTWNSIVGGTGATGSYPWVVPDFPSDSVLVKVTGNQFSGCDYDISDAKLKIASSVAVTAPNGGETWQATVGSQGNNINMSNATMVINTANYYDAGGITGNYGYTDFVQTFVPDNPLNKLKINITDWAFGSRYTYLSGQETHLYIYDGPTTNSSQIADLSFTGSSFTYTATSTSGALTFKLVCNGWTSSGWKGYITSVGTATKNINWNIIGTSKRFDLDYSINGGYNWTRIVSDLPVTTGTYAWQVPNTPTTTGRIRVRDAVNNAIVDSSDNNFTISPVTPVYVITTPNGGNNVYPTTTATIKWYSAFVGPYVNLDYSTDNGTTWLPIIANYPNYTNGSLSTEGTYPWVVPNTPSTKCLLRVSDADNSAAFDVSDANFTIKPFITVLSPNGGESKARCSAYSITWNAGGTSGYYNLSYSVDGGNSWLPIITNYNGTIYPNWTLPNVLTSQLKVKVSDFADTTKFDISDAGTSLTLPASPVRMIAPNGGETWVTGTTQYVTYAYGTGTTYVDLDYSTDFGKTWNTIVGGTGATGSYPWVVPDFPSDSVLVKVTGNQFSGCDYDISDAKLKIASSVAVTAPNGGETWQATVGVQGNNINMSNATMVINTANYYDAGGATGNYGYSDFVQTFVPDNPLNKLKINITDWAFGSRYTYLSGQEAHLYIYDGPTTNSSQIADLSFTGSSFTYTATSTSGALTFKLVCNGWTSSGWKGYITSVGTATKNINWNIIGTSKHFDLDYSINGGYNWTRIVSDLPVTTGTYAWQVPNTPTTTGRIRVRDAVNNAIVDSSDNNFTISPVTPVYVITTPNGGNNIYPTTTTTIKWYSAFVGPYVNLDYSIDNGTTWIPIIANYPNYTNGSLSTEGTYPWVVPNTPSAKCLLRVSDADNSAAFDVSDANFTIKPFITVLTPNGGESKARCSSYSITWNAGGTSGYYNLSYSVDGGTTWLPIISNYYGTSYPNWTLPNVLTSQLKVKVSDYTDSTKFDISDAGTTLTLPASPVRMISPNGGETWVAGTTQYVTYAYGTGTTYVDLDYSTDFGRTWSSIVGGTGANGSYAWIVPNAPSDSVLVKVTGNQFSGCDYDISDAKFKIVSTVQVTQPNGNESWQASVGNQGTNINMSNASMIINTANYYDNGGVTGNYGYTDYIQTFTPDNPLNKLKIFISDWAFGSRYTYLSGQETHLYIYDGPSTSYSQIADLSFTGSSFTYTATSTTGALTFKLVCNGWTSSGWKGYITSVGTATKNINWNIVGTSKRFDLDYSINGGDNWTRIVSDIANTTGTYAWQVPNTPTTQGRVRVRDAVNNVVVDSSDANFTINAATPFVIVNAPNGSERYYCGQTKNITWQAPTFNISTVKIELSMNGGATWDLITAATQNTGSYGWLVPIVTTPMPNCRIRISKADESYYYDVSDNDFEIRPGIVITSPNNNSSLFQACTISSVTWQGNASSNCSIELSTDSGQTWKMINANFAVTGFSNNYSWTIPNLPSDKCLVRVTDLNNTNYTDVSDSVFTIKPSLVLNYPSYGGVMKAGSTVAITWTAYSTSNYYNLDYSTDNGQTWVSIATNQYITTGTYNWVVPNVGSSYVKVRVTDFSSSCKTAQSTNPFVIAAKNATVNLSGPNAGTYGSCTPMTISWTSTGGSSVTDVNLLYSTNAGTTWNLIATNLSVAAGSYTWNNVPNIATTNGLIKIVDANDQNNYDISDNVFTITKAISVSITANKTTKLCDGDTVTLTSSSTVNNLWSNGATTQSILVTNTGNYSVNLTQGACVATSNVIPLAFNPSPAVPVVTANGSSTICSGSSVALLSNSTIGNTWLPGGQTTQGIIVTTSGNYAVMASNQYGCTATSSPVTVTVIQSSVGAVASSNAPVYNGLNLNLFATNVTGATYNWTGPNGFSSNQQNPVITDVQSNMSGVYTVQATIAGCPTPVSATSVSVISAPSVMIAGVVTNPKWEYIPNVKFNLTGATKSETMGDSYGNYLFEGYNGGAYIVTPSKNNDKQKANGVTTLDLIKIQSHILHIDTLNSPYKIIAADVNGSNTITTLDLIYIRRLILGLDTAFPGNKLWNFVDASYSFANPVNPFPYPSSKSFTLQSQLDSVNFKAIKMGDVTYDWNAAIPKGGVKQKVVLYTDKNNVTNQDTIRVKLKVGQFDKIKGLQLTFGWNAHNMKFVGVGNNPMAIEFGKQKVGEGLLAMQWNDAKGEAISLNHGAEFLELKFVKQSNFDQELVNFNSSITNIECFNDALESCDIKLEGGEIVNQKPAATSPAIYTTVKVYPNPTQGDLTVDVDGLPEGKIAYKITTLVGQSVGAGTLVKEIGNNQLKLNLQTLGVHRKGYYFISFMLNNKVVTYKILFI